MIPNADPTNPAAAPAAIGHNSEERPSGRPQSVRLDHIVIWPPAEAEIKDLTEAAIDAEIEIFSTAGQRCSAIGRERPDGKIEVVAKAFVVEAARRYAAINQSSEHTVDVIIHRLDDERAFRFLAQDVEAGPDWTSLARGRIFLSAVEKFGSVQAAAEACRVSKAAVSKNLDVARCIAVVGAKVAVQRDIAQRDAAWLMSVVGRELDGSDASNTAERKTILATIAGMEIASAKKVFASLRRVIAAAPPRRKGVEALMHENRQIGSVTRKRAGPIRIELTEAGDVELDALMRLLRKAITNTRRPTI